MHSLQQTCLLQADGGLARKSLLLASRLKHRQVRQPADPTVCTGEYKSASPCSYMQKKTSAAGNQQWLKQAQPLRKQQERSGTQRRCAHTQVRSDKSAPVSDDDDDDDDEDEDEDDEDDEWEQSSATPQNIKPVSPPRKPMQAISMPKKKRSPGDKILTVRLQGGGKARLPVSPEPVYTGIGDYARRVRDAGDFAAVSMLRLTPQSGSKAATLMQSIVGHHSTEMQKCCSTQRNSTQVQCRTSASMQPLGNNTIGVFERFECCAKAAHCLSTFDVQN